MWGKRAGMIVHGRSPFNAEPSRAALAEDPLTGIDTFYCRNHGPIPGIATDQWRLAVTGKVTRPLELTFNELTEGFSRHSVVATLQCAGNRRAGFNEVREIPGEDPWGPARSRPPSGVACGWPMCCRWPE